MEKKNVSVYQGLEEEYACRDDVYYEKIISECLVYDKNAKGGEYGHER